MSDVQEMRLRPPNPAEKHSMVMSSDVPAEIETEDARERMSKI